MTDSTHIWGAAVAVVGSLASTVAVLDKRARSDSEARLAEAKRAVEVLTLATAALERNSALQERLLSFLESHHA